jgi:hypothetical protein
MSETNPSCTAPKTGEFSWNELITKDTTASANFYGKLFGWQSAPFVRPEGSNSLPPYFLFKTEASPMGVGGMMQAMQPGTPTQWLPYVVVDNVDTSLARAVELGAKVVLPAIPVPQVGRIAVIIDPQGAAIGLHELPKQSA